MKIIAIAFTMIYFIGLNIEYQHEVNVPDPIFVKLKINPKDTIPVSSDTDIDMIDEFISAGLAYSLCSGIYKLPSTPGSIISERWYEINLIYSDSINPILKRLEAWSEIETVTLSRPQTYLE